jgi:hypothetical protein
VVGALCIALGVSACGSTSSSTGGYKGEKGEVAKAISDLESNATANSASKVCKEDIASVVTKRLERNGSSCLKAMTSQLRQVDTFTMTVESISISKPGKSATAKVKSTWSGKQRESTLYLVKEDGTWKLASLS